MTAQGPPGCFYRRACSLSTMSNTLMLQKAKEFLEDCYKEKDRDCFEETGSLFDRYGRWMMSISYSCVYQLYRELAKLISEDLELTTAFNKLLCGFVELDLEFDGKLYLRMIELLQRYESKTEDEHLAGHARDIEELLKTALKLGSGISCG